MRDARLKHKLESRLPGEDDTTLMAEDEERKWKWKKRVKKLT